MNGAAVPGDVVEVTVLKSQPDSDKALELLRKIHSKVKPIMRVHGWVLPTLAEFFPKNPNLLGININRGQKICIRLRPAHDPHSFLPLEEELIGTMLHELTHNHRGPHDEVFNKFLDGLWNEYDALAAKGYAGEGFLGHGRRVGEGVAHDAGVSLREARDKALARFEERERMRKLLGTGGRLGGNDGTDPRSGRRMGDILADAAERRLKARKGCGGSDGDHLGGHTSGSKQQDLPREVQDEIERAEEDSRTVVIDLTQDSDDDDDDDDDFGKEELVPRGNKRAGDWDEGDRDRKPKLEREESPDLIIVSSTAPALPVPPPATTSKNKKRPVGATRPGSTSASKGQPGPPRSSSSAAPTSTSTLTATPNAPGGGWSCTLCTFYNPSSLHLVCSVCECERPPPRSTLPTTMTLKSITGTTKQVAMKNELGDGGDDVWVCHQCAREMDNMFWTCRDCGTMKLNS